MRTLTSWAPSPYPVAPSTVIVGSKSTPSVTVCAPGENCDVTIKTLASSRNSTDAPKFGYKTKVKSEIFSDIVNANGSVNAVLAATASGKIKSTPPLGATFSQSRRAFATARASASVATPYSPSDPRAVPRFPPGLRPS